MRLRLRMQLRLLLWLLRRMRLLPRMRLRLRMRLPLLCPRGGIAPTRGGFISCLRCRSRH
jgi:hypothetical protein